MNMRSWHVVQDICKMKSKNEIVRVGDEIVTLGLKHNDSQDHIPALLQFHLKTHMIPFLQSLPEQHAMNTCSFIFTFFHA